MISFRKAVFGFATALCMTVSANAMAATEKYTLDSSHTGVVFMIKHAGFSNTIGSFRTVSGMFEIDRDNPENSSVQVNIDPSSIQTPSSELDEKLRTEKFFDTAKFPNMRFESTKVKRTGQNTAEMTGNLTMHGVTKPITLNVTMNKEGEMFGKQRIGFSARGSLKRSEFGIKEYVPMVSDEVELIIETEGVKDEPIAPAVKQ